MRWTDPPRWLDWTVVVWLRNCNVQLRLGGYGFVIVSLAWVAATAYALLAEGDFAPGNEPPAVWHMSAGAIWFSLLTLVIVTDVGETVKDDAS